MKIAVLKGSPHKMGSSNTLAAEFVRGAKEAGHDITELDIAHMDIHPCIGCGHCGMNGPCVYKDDNETVKEVLLGTDMAVFVSPIYYFGMSAQLKAGIDRFYSYTRVLSERKLKAALITAAWDPEMDAVKYLADHYQKICRYMNFEDQGMVLGIGCGTVDMTKSSKYLSEAYQLGRRL